MSNAEWNEIGAKAGYESTGCGGWREGYVSLGTKAKCTKVATATIEAVDPLIRADERELVLEAVRGQAQLSPVAAEPYVYIPKPSDEWTCAHCSGDMRVDDGARCYHGGLHYSIANFEEDRQEVYPTMQPPLPTDGTQAEPHYQMIDAATTSMMMGVCSECGALVADGFTEKHTAWHKEGSK